MNEDTNEFDRLMSGAAPDFASEALASVAHLVGAFYRALLEEGFTEGQALVLADSYLTTSLRGA